MIRIKSTFLQLLKRKESLILLVIIIAGMGLFGWLSGMWASSKQGNIPFNPQELVLIEICRDTFQILKQGAAAKDIKLDCSGTGEIKVFADIDMLKTVLRNLISNAIKFSYPGGEINISALKSHSDIIISVSDNGTGIAPENISKLFDISQIISTKGTDMETGTGMGLLLCREFLEKNGGRIWVESEEGKGSDFKITLPAIPDRTN